MRSLCGRSIFVKSESNHKPRVLIYAAFALSVLLLLFVGKFIWTSYQHAGSPGDDRPSFDSEELSKRDRRYLERLRKPPLSCDEVVEVLRREKGINTQELYDMVSWYVSRGSEDVTRQLIANLPHEIELLLPEETNGTFIERTTKCKYMGPLITAWVGQERLGRLLHRELLKYSADEKTDPHLIYLLIESIYDNDENGNETYRFRLFADDMLAYIRICSNYLDWPTITEYAERMMIAYPWYPSFSLLQEVLQFAQDESPEAAYEMYMRRFRENYHKDAGSLVDLNDPNRFYRVESEFKGWCSENVTGRTLVYNVSSDAAAIGIPYVEKVVFVSRDGTDITSDCAVAGGHVMIIPLKQAEVIELKYKIHVTQSWWPCPVHLDEDWTVLRYMEHGKGQSSPIAAPNVPAGSN
jgi:hypothetical protein